MLSLNSWYDFCDLPGRDVVFHHCFITPVRRIDFSFSDTRWRVLSHRHSIPCHCVHLLFCALPSLFLFRVSCGWIPTDRCSPPRASVAIAFCASTPSAIRTLTQPPPTRRRCCRPRCACRRRRLLHRRPHRRPFHRPALSALSALSQTVGRRRSTPGTRTARRARDVLRRDRSKLKKRRECALYLFNIDCGF